MCIFIYTFQLRVYDQERIQFGIGPAVHVERHGALFDWYTVSVGTYSMSLVIILRRRHNMSFIQQSSVPYFFSQYYVGIGFNPTCELIATILSSCHLAPIFLWYSIEGL